MDYAICFKEDANCILYDWDNNSISNRGRTNSTYIGDFVGQNNIINYTLYKNENSVTSVYSGSFHPYEDVNDISITLQRTCKFRDNSYTFLNSMDIQVNYKTLFHSYLFYIKHYFMNMEW